MNLINAKEVFDTRDLKEVNLFLSLGWDLIDTYIEDFGDAHHKNEVLHYVLVWVKEHPVLKPEKEIFSGF